MPFTAPPAFVTNGSTSALAGSPSLISSKVQLEVIKLKMERINK